MPNIKSAKKRVQVSAVKQAENRVTMSVMRTSMKKVKIAAANGDKELANTLYKQAASSIDKAARKGVIHANNAANKKSSLAKLVNNIA